MDPIFEHNRLHIWGNRDGRALSYMALGRRGSLWGLLSTDWWGRGLVSLSVLLGEGAGG
jgi:hypothetical protein